MCIKDQRIYLEDPRPIVPPAKRPTVVPRPAFRRKPRRCGSTAGPSSNRPPPGNPSPCATARKARCGWRFCIATGVVVGWRRSPGPAWHLIVRREDRHPDRDQVQPQQRPGGHAGALGWPSCKGSAIGSNAPCNRANRTSAGRLPGPGLARLAPSHDPGHDGDAVSVGRASASPADPTVVERSRISGRC
jgi:hypothetical protein